MKTSEAVRRRALALRFVSARIQWLPASIGKSVFISRDLGLKLQCESDLVESLKQASAPELIDWEAMVETLAVANGSF